MSLMLSSSHSSMEINVASAEGLLLSGRRPGKSAFFVAVRTGSRVHEAATTDASDRDAGPRGCPTWNQQLNLPLPPLASSISLEVRCGSVAGAGSKAVAAVTVPLSDFAGAGPEGHLHLLSYRLRDERGERNGIIHFSVRVFGVAARRHMERPPVPATCRTGLGYERRKMAAGGGGAAVGYPLGYGHRVGAVSSK